MKKKNPDHVRLEAWAMPILQDLAKKLLLDDFAPLTFKYGVQDRDATAESNVSYPYKTIHIKYSDDMVKDFKEGIDVTATLIHEMCHPLTDPLYCKGINRYSSRNEINDERERLTDHIANIISKNGLVDIKKKISTRTKKKK